MVFEQYYLGCLAHASYLIADEARATRPWSIRSATSTSTSRDAAELGCRIEHVFLTHLHADFVAGHLELRDRARAPIYLGARASAEYAFTPLGDGELLELGRRAPPGARDARPLARVDLDPRLRPGADEHEPYAVLTGDTLFIGDVGRPDLRASLGWSAEELAGMLYDSVHEKLLPLPDETLVYPAHGAGSLCGKNLSHRDGLDDRRAAPLQLRAAADEPGAVHRDRHRRSARHAGLLHLRRGAQRQERPTLDEALERELQPLRSRGRWSWPGRCAAARHA